MKRLLTTLILLAAVAAWATAGLGINPYAGPAGGSGFSITVTDLDIDTSWELMTADTGYTAMPNDTTLSVAWAAQSKFDSLRTGNAGVGSLQAVFTLPTTADQSVNNNFLQDRNTGTVSYLTAVFGDGASPQWNAYLTRWDDDDFNLDDDWRIAVFTAGLSAGNPGVGTVQTVFSVHESPHQLRLDFQPDGGIAGVVTDDGNATTDSVLYIADVYDSSYHWIVFSCASSTLRLRVNNNTALTKSLTNASQPLSLVDTLTLLGSRGGANDFRGRIDEFYYMADQTTFDTEMEDYVYQRTQAEEGNAVDSARVYVRGLFRADSTYGSSVVEVPASAAATTDSSFMLFENAYMDTSESIPLLVFTTGYTPRQAKQDSLLANLLHYPNAHQLFGKSARTVTRQLRSQPSLKSVIFSNYGANAVTYELRLYHDLTIGEDYSDDYEVLFSAYIPSGGDAVDFSWPQGKMIEPFSALAAFAKGDGANAKGSVTFVGKRQSRAW